MKRIRLDEPVTFDLPYHEKKAEPVTLRVRIDRDGITLWKKAQGNLDQPRQLDKFIQLTWEAVGKTGFCYAGTRSGHEQRGPGAGRAGLHYLTHKRK